MGINKNYYWNVPVAFRTFCLFAGKLLLTHCPNYKITGYFAGNCKNRMDVFRVWRKLNQKFNNIFPRNKSNPFPTLINCFFNSSKTLQKKTPQFFVRFHLGRCSLLSKSICHDTEIYFVFFLHLVITRGFVFADNERGESYEGLETLFLLVSVGFRWNFS